MRVSLAKQDVEKAQAAAMLVASAVGRAKVDMRCSIHLPHVND